MLEQDFHLPAAAEFPVQLAGRQQLAALLLRHISLVDADVPLPIGIKPLGLERHLHSHADADEIALLELVIAHQVDQPLDPLTDVLENAGQIVVVVGRNVSGPRAPA